MLNFFIGFAFFEAGAIFGFFVAALMQAARSGEIGQYPQQVEIDNDLKALQQAVGGSIGASYPFANDPVAIVYNDDGKLMGLPLNRALRDENGQMYDAIAGDFLVVGLGEEDFVSLSPELRRSTKNISISPKLFSLWDAA